MNILYQVLSLLHVYMILKVMFCAIFTLGSRSMRMSLYRAVDSNGLLKITRLLNDAFIIS